jgi:hypothetical protein
MPTESFYVVWNPADRNPIKRHDDVQSATEEARRLAQANPGIEFITLRAIKGITWRDDPWRIRDFCKSK